MNIQLHRGNNLELLLGLADNSIDSIVTDPPYGLSFMGKKWDYDVPSVDLWRECLRVLKPGGHLLAFAGTRTQHRMAVRIEDAGFEIRDMIAWVYGSGFPKSMDVSKALDRMHGAASPRRAVHPAAPGEVYGKYSGEIDDDNAITDDAKQWQGWGTALKPALEPITVARKPLVGTVAENVLEFGTGAINIAGCRIEGVSRKKSFGSAPSTKNAYGKYKQREEEWEADENGRWPANFIHDGDDSVISGFPVSNQIDKRSEKIQHQRPGENGIYNAGWHGDKVSTPSYSDTGSAARFFYCAKASRTERNAGLEDFEKKSLLSSGTQSPGTFQSEGSDRSSQNFHPTVKPIALMRYLCRLITPPGGTVLDPFMGSGTTGIAAKLEGFDFIGMDLSGEYVNIATARIDWWTPERWKAYELGLREKEKPEVQNQPSLFDPHP